MQVTAVVNPSHFGKRVSGMGVQIRPLLPQRVRQKHFSGKSWRRNDTVLQQTCTLHERSMNGQQGRLR
jgi:hypothetical protein